jgi:multicomponent Na+:H+ antiporter subunit B
VTVLFGVFLLTLLVITAIAIVRATDLFVAVMLTGIFSLLTAVIFFLLDAADVALTEAAIGAGISTVLFLGALSLTGEQEQSPSNNKLIALLVVAITTIAILYATFDKPRVGDPDAPVQTHVAPWYLEKTAEFIDIPNAVTAVLGSFRGYDTFGEVFVVLTAGIGVLFLLGKAPPPGAYRKQSLADDKGLRHYLIPRLVGRLVIPFIILFGFYVQFHGEYGPGGGFQAGAIIAAGIILFALLEGEKRALEVIPHWFLRLLMAGGALIYGLVGVANLFLGGNFLDYSTLSNNPVNGEQLGIILIEAGVGITVTGVLLSIYYAFATRGKS